MSGNARPFQAQGLFSVEVLPPFMICVVSLVGLSARPVFGQDFAPEGTRGTVEVTVLVTGQGTVPGPGPGTFDSKNWKVRHTAQFKAELQAYAPALDGTDGNVERVTAYQEEVDKHYDEDDEALQEEWDERLDACEENEACEDRVIAAMMMDPKFQKLARKMQGAAPALMEKAGAIDLRPRFQLWSYDPMAYAEGRHSVVGQVRAEQTEDIFGALDTGGGGKVDVTVRYLGEEQLGSDVQPVLQIDARTSGFELYIPANLGLTIDECEPSGEEGCTPTGNKKGVQLLGAVPSSGADWQTALTFTGKVGSVSRPTLSGTASFGANLGDPDDPRGDYPVEVTIEWSFKPNAR